MFLEKTSYFNLTVFASMTSIFFSYCQTTTSLDTNNLSLESSPYLLQHAQNPVFWQRWKKGAYKEMNTTDKLLIISLGYSSCHWCHVMEKETFEDINVAKEMNENFISIKVDREENPDVDNIYMTAVQMMTGSGGWPLNVICLPDGRPIYGGTYHSKKQWLEILTKVQQLYTTNKDKLIAYADKIEKGIQQVNSIEISTKINNFSPKLLEKEITLWEKKWDENHGGEKQNQKFITPVKFNYIQQFQALTDSPKVTIYLKNSLTTIANSGVYDHVEGGFFRYSIDSSWNIPHFEKMLYDNVQFVLLISKFLKINKNDYFKRKIIQTIKFMNKSFLNSEHNLLGSAFDADSDGEEGKYYVFSYNELKDIKDIEQYFDIRPEGNWENKIILREIKTPPDSIIIKLKELRKKKNKPFFDKKVQLDLNCFWVSALLSAEKILPNNSYLQIAETFYNNLEKLFLSEEKLFHTNSKNSVFLEDYAYAIAMLLDLSDQTLKPNYLFKAKHLCKKTIELFYVKEKFIFQKNIITDNDIFHKPIDISDNNIINGNSIMLLNFSRLGMRNEAKELSNSLNGYLNIYKSSMVGSLKAIDYYKMIESINCSDTGCVI